MSVISPPASIFKGKNRARLPSWHAIVTLYQRQSYCKFIEVSRALVVN